MIVVQRYPPDWSRLEESRSIGEIGVRLFDVQPFSDGGFSSGGRVSIGRSRHGSTFRAAIVDDADSMPSQLRQV